MGRAKAKSRRRSIHKACPCHVSNHPPQRRDYFRGLCMDNLIDHEYEYETPAVLATYDASDILAEAETSSVIIVVS